MNFKNPLLAWALLAFGVAVASTSVLMIKASAVHPFMLSSLRLLIAVVLLWPLYIRESRSRKAAGLAPAGHKEAFRAAVVPSIALALHFMTWVVGARLTSAGNSTLIVNMVPVAMPFAAVFLTRTRPSRLELLATLVAFSGVVLMSAGDFNFSRNYFLGDAVCLGSMVLFAVYLALARRNNPDGRLFTYVVPLYALAGLECLAAAAIAPEGLARPSSWDLLMMVGLAVGPTVIGHSVLNWAMTVLRPQAVSIANLFQFVFAVVFAYFLFGEKPQALFWPVTALIVAGALIAVWDSSRAAARDAGRSGIPNKG